MTTLTHIQPNLILVYTTDDAEARFKAALLLVDRIEPTANSGLATAYRNRAGVLLTKLDEVVRAIVNNDLASNPPA